MRTMIFTFSALIALAAAAPSPAQTMNNPVSGSSCAGQNVEQTDDNFGLVLNGMCGDVVISGSHGYVNMDGARSIRVTGSHVTVLGEKNPLVIVEGHDNTFNLTDIGALLVAGDTNVVMGTNAKSLDMKGTGNKINVDKIDVIKSAGNGNQIVR